jgi:hypothetical protein
MIPPALVGVHNSTSFLPAAADLGREEGGVMSRDLPPRPSIEFLKKEAKELLDAMERGDAAALERFLALAHRPPGAAPHLADAQHVLAREYGFAG